MDYGAGTTPLLAYLEALFGREEGQFVEIAHRPRGAGMRRGAKGGLFLPATQLRAAAEAIESLAEGADVWVGVLPRRPDPETGEIGGSKDFIPNGRVLWVDCDLRETADGAERLRGFRPRPHLVVRSGGGFHAYWLLSEPLDRDWIPIANRRLAYAIGADQAATDAARILRPPGTRNFKYRPPRPVELASSSPGPPLGVREIVGALPNPPGRRARPRPRYPSALEAAADPLRTIPPPVYVRALAGVEVPDIGGMVSCPLPDHEDPEPSCQVFADPARGWYCYGCQRGGSIYDFAAHLVGERTRGREFIGLRRELERRFSVPQRREPGGPTERRRAGAPPSPSFPPQRRRPAGPTALLQTPATDVQVNRSVSTEAEAGDGPDGHEVDDDPPPSPPSPPPALVAAPAFRVLAVGIGALLIAMGGFVLVFAILPLSQPETGNVVCAVSGEARGTVPGRYLVLYRQAGRRFGIDWAVLAAIGQVESGHGRNTGPSSAGALGPMQFLPATWRAYGLDGDDDGHRDVHNPADAIFGAANYLRASGAPIDLRRALFAYNHADWYVDLVLHTADEYRAACRAIDGPHEGGSGPLGWPVRGAVTSGFGMRWGRMHAGIDIAAATGTPVHAAERGRVSLRGPYAGYGNYLCIRHLPQLTTCYAHLSAYRTRLGRIARRGEVIGLVGCTGGCFGSHLHFEARLGAPFSRPVDPLRYLGMSE